MAKIVKAFVTKLRKVHWVINGGGVGLRREKDARRALCYEGRGLFLWEVDHHHTYSLLWKAEHNLATLRITHASRTTTVGAAASADC